MRIALFSETYVPAINGVATHVNLLQSGLKKLGHEVLVVCAKSGLRKHVLKNGVLYCPALKLKRIYNSVVAGPISPSRYKYIKNFNPDIIHIHTEFGIGYSGVSAAKFLKIPLVYTMHTMYDNYIYYVASKKFSNIVKRTSHAYAKILAQKASCITGPSKKVAEFFKNCGVNKPVYVIPNPVDLDVFNFNNFSSAEKLSLRAKFGVKPNELLICFCGRLGREKSVDLLLELLSEVDCFKSNCKLLILGDGPCMNELKNCCAKLNLQNQVIFAGEVAHAKLAPYYAACNIYITTSLTDTNSISMLEAMASGLPVYHLYDELNRNQIEDGVNGYFFKNSVELKKLFESYLNMNKETKMELKNRVRSSVLKFGDVSLASRLLKIYDLAFNASDDEKMGLRFHLNFKRIGRKSRV